MNISKLITYMPMALFVFAVVFGQAWADDVDAPKKKGGPDTEDVKHDNTRETTTTGEMVGEHDAVVKRGGPDGVTHENTEEVNTTGEWDGDVDAPNKSAAQRLVGSQEEEFMALDINNDGLIDEDERVGDAAMTRQIVSIDGNGDGVVDKREYRAYYGMRYGSRPLRHLGDSDPAVRGEYFKILDKDGNGELSVTEIEAAHHM